MLSLDGYGAKISNGSKINMFASKVAIGTSGTYIQDSSVPTNPGLIVEGNVGIGTAAPGTKLEVNGGRARIFTTAEPYALGLSRSDGGGLAYWLGVASTGELVFNNNSGLEKMRLDTNGQLGIQNTAPSVALDVTGDIEYSGTITDVSDIRLKKDITPLDKSDIINRLGQIDTYSFRMIADKKGQLEFGVIAQEVEKIFPELVRTEDTAESYKSVNYVGFIAPLIEASKDLKAENDNLKAEIIAMKAQQDEMKTALNDIAADMKGMKVHTGYGISKAQMNLMMILAALGTLALAFFARRKIISLKSEFRNQK